jgi:hypothetical protein
MAMNTKQRKAANTIIADKYSIPFAVEEDAICFRQMGKNFPDGIIPQQAQGEIMAAVINNKTGFRPTVKCARSVAEYRVVPILDTATVAVAQRDGSPNHVYKIERVFDSRKMMVPCAIFDRKSGKYLIWDGNHTIQALYRQGATHVGINVVEAPPGEYATLAEERAAMYQWAAGAFLTNNKTHKKPVSGYDEYHIRLEVALPESVRLEKIVSGSACQVARRALAAGDITHTVNLLIAYKTATLAGSKGVYLRRALTMHRTTWPHEPIQGVVMLALVMLYAQCEVETGSMPDEDFDAELGAILRLKYGHSDAVYHTMKTSYENTKVNGKDGMPNVVAAGLVQAYIKNCNRIDIGQAEVRFPV